METIYDAQIYQCHVTPMLCKELRDLGLTEMTTHQWKVYKHDTILDTTAFDMDDYYLSARKHVDFINPPVHVLPAYTIKDVEKVLPSWILTCDDLGNYEMSIHNIYKGVPPQTAKRLPDVYAMMLKEGIVRRVVSVEKINEKIARMV